MNRKPSWDDGKRTALLPKPHGMEELAEALDAVS